MSMVTIHDFERVRIGSGLPEMLRHYTKDGREVCLEPCMDGFCVGIYDDEEELIGEKRCTKLGQPTGELVFGEEVHEDALKEAVRIANEMLGKCEWCRGEGTFIDDTYDHRGEHVQTTVPCAECMGTGTGTG